MMPIEMQQTKCQTTHFTNRSHEWGDLLNNSPYEKILHFTGTGSGSGGTSLDHTNTHPRTHNLLDPMPTIKLCRLFLVRFFFHNNVITARNLENSGK